MQQSRPISVALAAWGILLAGVAAPSAAPADALPAPDRPVADAHSLCLRAGTIELRSRASLLAPGAAFDPAAHYVLQLDGPITPPRRAALLAAGVEIGDYLPLYAYLVGLGGVRAEDLIALGFVRWVGPFEGAWKVCPRIASAKPYRTDARRALAASGRRRLVVHLFDGADAPAAAAALRARGATIVQGGRGPGDPIELEIGAADVPRLAEVSEVLFVEEAPEGAPRNASTTWICQSNRFAEVPLWSAGIHGENQIVGLIDWDLDAGHCAFSDSVPIGPAHRKILAYYGMGENPGFGWHGTHVGGILTGDELADTDRNLKGLAFASRLVFQHQAAVITATNLYERLSIAHDDGARVHSNSWGSTFDSSYNAWARDIDRFSRDHEEDLVTVAIINGPANSPPGSLLSPENAKNCLAVGACGDAPDQDLHGNGASGPTDDGRQKPEVWVPGCGTNSAQVQTPCQVLERPCFTSWAAPAASALGVLARQYFVDGYHPSGRPTPADARVPSGALLKAILLNAATDMTAFGTPEYFGPHEGWGRILLDDAVFLAGDKRRLIVEDVWNDAGLSTGERDTLFVAVPNVSDVPAEAEPLKITLVWTDVPATIGAARTPVNDLDLVVTDPMGVVYRGNFFQGTESAFGGVPDRLNNAEQVHRNHPREGIWRIEVVATAVNVDTQGYALVVSGDVLSPARPRGDLNGDGAIDGRDIGRFVAVYLEGGTIEEEWAADVDGRNGLDAADPPALVRKLLAAP